MKALLIRTGTALAGIAIFLLCCFGGLVPFTLAVTALSALAAWEFIGGFRQAANTPRLPGKWTRLETAFARWNAPLTWLGATAPIYAYIISRDPGGPQDAFALVRGLVVVVLLYLLMRAARVGYALGPLRAMYGVLGFFYAGTLFGALVLLRSMPNMRYVRPFGWADFGAWLVLFVACCVWATDTGAFFVGKALGRHKLAPAISPGKTREGAIGGVIAAVVCGLAFAHWIRIAPMHGLVIGLVAGTVGQAGDLFESALKRELGLKDFGRALPGHGGALDRFDSLLFVAPLAYLYLHFVAGL